MLGIHRRQIVDPLPELGSQLRIICILLDLANRPNRGTPTQITHLEIVFRYVLVEQLQNRFISVPPKSLKQITQSYDVLLRKHFRGGLKLLCDPLRMRNHRRKRRRIIRQFHQRPTCMNVHLGLLMLKQFNQPHQPRAIL